MKKLYNSNPLNKLLFFFVATLISLNSYSQTLSPTVNVSLSNSICGQLSDLSIDVSQDAGETDILNSVFTSDAGSFDLSNLNIGDTVGTADMNFLSGNNVNTILVVGSTSSFSTIILSLDSTGTLGSFTLRNDTNGIEITAASPGGDGNNTTGGYTSNVTFHNLFLNPTVSLFTFSSTITSELSQVDNQSFIQFMSCADFSPSVNLILSNTDCGLLTDVTLDVSQDAGEIDMASALFTTDGGSFDLASLSIGSMVGTATVSAGANSYTADLFVNNLSSNTATIEDNLSLNTFLIENLTSGGVSISTTSPGDNNYTTINGNSTSVLLQNIFNNTSTSVLGFSSVITSEIGQTDNQSINLLMSCTDFSPTVSASLSHYVCDSVSDLTINVSQDAGETDMATALFVSDGGSFTISSLSIGDNIGSASLTNSILTYNTDLYVTSITGSTVTVSDSLANTFLIENLSAGVSITATSPGDNNSTTSGNTSSVTFNNIFHNPNNGIINFTSTITSELGEVDVQNFSFNMSCMDFSPTVAITLSDNTCQATSDLTINVSQDANETDIASASFVSDGGAFNISGLSVNDVVGSASIFFANGTTVISNLELSLINSLDDFEVQSIDSLGNVLGTFAVTNILGGGVDILATSPPDGNSSTNGYVSTATFNSLFVNPTSTSSFNLNFTTTITSELGMVDVQSLSYVICCDPFLSVTITACDSFDWDGVTYDSTGTYTNVYTDIYGCDSTVTLNLTINNSSSSTVTITSCDSFDWDGVTYDLTGTYTNVYTGTNGCDSTVTLDLTINSSDSTSFTASACDTSYFWNGVTYNMSGSYSQTLTNISGCDSVVTLNLTIGYTESSTVTITACDSFDWDGVSYDSTGMYTNTYTNISGCDSTVTLDLTITGFSSSSTVTITACDSFDWDGMTYDSTGMYTNIYTGLNGCDSTVTLDLTINNSSSSTVTITACDSFDWDGVTYDSTGTYTNVYTDVNGCDSTVTLDLTINDGPNDATVIQNGDSLTVTVSTGTAPYTYEWNTGETTQSILPDSSGTYYCIVTDANGCEDWSNQYVYTSTSISELNSNKMSVYPNPTKGILNIEFNNFDKRYTSLSIVNILGEEIYTEELDNTFIKYSNQLDLSEYSNGIYFVKFSSIEEVLTKKLILQ
ncbi:T9SS type A sorting domain-containing protein [Flavobacteriales bacterium]|nr:T9SS type A sorting domain-containing protein [Flavobacteriales bacterium]